MEKLNIQSDIKFCSVGELSVDDMRLVTIAMDSTKNSYSPYSKFKVGAAVRLSDGTIIRGANQENAAFSVTICAERSAIFAAQANHPELPITAIAIAACNEQGFTNEPIAPCGTCRQAMVEIEQKYGTPLHILLYGQKGVYVMDSIRNLMPLSFFDMK